MPKTKKTKTYLIYLAIGLVIIGGLWWYIREYQALPIPAYYLLSTTPMPKATDRILVISPHPDDEIIAAGGLIQNAIQDKATLRIAEITDGNKHGLKDLRYQELKDAVALLGVNAQEISFLNFPDGLAKNYIPEIQNNLSQIISQFKPTILVYPYGLDEHPDHKAVHAAVENIIQKSNIAVTRYQYLVHYPRYPRPGGYQPNNFLLPMLKTIDFTTSWSQLPVNGNEEQAKHMALNQYRSQLSAKNPVLRELLVAFVRKNELFVIN